MWFTYPVPARVMVAPRSKGGKQMREIGCEKNDDEELRSWLHSQVDAASDIVPPLWPLRTFVSVNPLVGLEDLPFEEAVRHAKTLFGGEGYLSIEEYRHLYHAGRITSRDVTDALAFLPLKRSGADALAIGSRRIHPSKVLWVHSVYGLDEAEPADERLPLRHPNGPTLRRDLPEVIKAHLIRRVQDDPAYRPPEPDCDIESHCASLLWSAVLSRADVLFQKGLDAQAHEVPNRKDFLSHPRLQPPASEAAQLHSDGLLRALSQIGQHETLGDWCHAAAGVHIPELVNRQMIKWCAAFLDEGQAAWPMPHRELGFYGAWRTLAAHDLSARRMGIAAPSRKVRAFPSQPEDALISGLRALGVSEERWADYLRRHLAQLPGWAGFIRWRSEYSNHAGQGKHPIDLVQYLAVRIFYEAELVDGVCRKTWGIPGSLPAIEAHWRRGHTRRTESMPNEGSTIRSHDGSIYPLPVARTTNPTTEAPPSHRSSFREPHHHRVLRPLRILFEAAQFLGLSPTEVRQLPTPTIRSLLSLVDLLPPEAQRLVWQEAYETHYRRSLLHQLSDRRHGSGRTAGAPSNPGALPAAQVAFCIDARSEGLRRHLESLGPYETLGMAGFFGIPMRLRPLDSSDETASCPVLIKPTRVVVEVPEGDQKEHLKLRRFKTRWLRMAESLFRDLKGNIITPYVLIEAVGGLFSLPLVGKTLWPQGYGRVIATLRDWFIPSVATVPGIDRVHGTDALEMPATSDRSDNAQAPKEEPSPVYGSLPEERPAWDTSTGFTTSEQVDLVDDALRVMGLTQGFAQLIVLLGHGSTTENNPHAASLDCGACGGNRGGPNAKVLATMANKPAVRTLLRGRGIAIPNDTWFLAGEHNTTTDHVTLFDLSAVPLRHRDGVARLVSDLEEAGSRLSWERIARLPTAPKDAGPLTARRHVELRSVDWAQVQPEWGLARNAAFIIAERKLTQGINLNGRCFLHSYDHNQDNDGKVLEVILTGPLVVAAWINLQYYFSSVDNRVYGSGSKVIHNVVGGIGAMLGNRSDLQVGLPLQAVMDGANRYHEPMRLLTVIQAPVDRIARVIRHNAPVEQLFRNGWVTLVALDPITKRFLRYLPDGGWSPLPERTVRSWRGETARDEGIIAAGRSCRRGRARTGERAAGTLSGG